MILNFLGIDPGKGGGLAAITLIPPEHEGVVPNRLVVAEKMPEWEDTVWAWLEPFLKVGAAACVERVKEGNSYGFVYGIFRGMPTAATRVYKTEWDAVSSWKWQKEMRADPRKCFNSEARWRNHLKRLAWKDFPHENLTTATAKSLLLAEYCRRTHQFRNADKIGRGMM